VKHPGLHICRALLSLFWASGSPKAPLVTTSRLAVPLCARVIALAASVNPASAETTIRAVKQIWSGGMAQAAGKYGEHAPMAAACCNACRTCVTTNIIGVVMAAFAGAGYAALRLIGKRGRVSPS
jgi:hypothetical protein